VGGVLIVSPPNLADEIVDPTLSEVDLGQLPPTYAISPPADMRVVPAAEGLEGEGVAVMIAGPDAVLRVYGPLETLHQAAPLVITLNEKKQDVWKLNSLTFELVPWREGEALRASLPADTGGREYLMSYGTEDGGWLLVLEDNFPASPKADADRTAIFGSFQPAAPVLPVLSPPQARTVAADGWFSSPLIYSPRGWH